MLALFTGTREALVDDMKFWTNRASGKDPQTRTASTSYSPGKAPCYHQYQLKDRKYKYVIKLKVKDEAD